MPAIAARNAARTIRLETFLHSLIGIRWNIRTLPLIFYSVTSSQNIPAYRRLQISSGHPCAPRPCSLNTSSNFAASDFYLNYISRSPHLQLPFPLKPVSYKDFSTSVLLLFSSRYGIIFPTDSSPDTALPPYLILTRSNYFISRRDTIRNSSEYHCPYRTDIQ